MREGSIRRWPHGHHDTHLHRPNVPFGICTRHLPGSRLRPAARRPEPRAGRFLGSLLDDPLRRLQRPRPPGHRSPPRLVRARQQPVDPARHLAARPSRQRPRQCEVLGQPAGPRRLRGRQPRRHGPPDGELLVRLQGPDRRPRPDAGDHDRAPCRGCASTATASTRSAAAWAARRPCCSSRATPASSPAPPQWTPSPTSAAATASCPPSRVTRAARRCTATATATCSRPR